MVSAFASQLQTIAQKSTHELDLKARRSAHAESLLFDRAVAAKQDFDSLYAICSDGFQELCQLDGRFHEFDDNLFSEQARVQDRDQLTKADHAALDSVINHCLILLGSRILLNPAVKALEWLVRRFRVHVHNIDYLLCTLLPYHETQIWANVLSIIPNEKIVNQWKFIRPYLKTTWNVPRHAIAYAAANNDGFFSTLNSYVLETCRRGPAHTALMKFWSSLVVEATSNRLTQTRSGRRELQRQRTEDFLHKILPLISDGFETTGTMDLITTCYTISIVLVARAELEDYIIDSLMLAVVQTLNHADFDSQAVLITIAILVSHKQDKNLPKKVVSILADLEVLPTIIRKLRTEFDFTTLLSSLIGSTVAYIKSKTAHKLAAFLKELVLLLHNTSTPDALAIALQPVVTKVIQLGMPETAKEDVANLVIIRLQQLNEDEHIATAFLQAAEKNGQNHSLVEDVLGMTISLPGILAANDIEDVVMEDASTRQDNSHAFDAIPPEWQEISFMASPLSKEYSQFASRFEQIHSDIEKLAAFMTHPIWTAVVDGHMLWQTFLLRYTCTHHSIQSRIKALNLLAEAVKSHPACNLQYYVPYLLVLLTEPRALRKTASEFLSLVFELVRDPTQELNSDTSNSFYAAKSNPNVSMITNQQLSHILEDVVLPVTEECRLDQGYIVKRIHQALDQSASETKKGHKQALFALLSQHAVATPLLKTKLGILSMLRGFEKIGNKFVFKALLPIVKNWSELPLDHAQRLADEAGVLLSTADSAFMGIADAQGTSFLEQLQSAANDKSCSYRTGIVAAYLEDVKLGWIDKSGEQQLTTAEILFNLSFGTDEVLAIGAQDVLRSVQLNSEVIATLMHIAQAGSIEMKAPAAKRKRRSSHNVHATDVETSKVIELTVARIGMALELLEGNKPETKHELAGSVFEMLSSLRTLQQNRISSPYLINLCLTCALATTQAARSQAKAVDAASVRPDLVTDVLRNTDNPQVQNSALQLLASLSTVVPDRMVHNVMPVFTFIGHNMLAKDDEHSVNVVNEAIDSIVPALLENLKKSKNSTKYQASVVSMLASFTSSYDHIAAHRRVAFYQKLLQSIDMNTFGFIMLALLADQHYKNADFSKFVQDILSPSAAHVQLCIYQQLLETALDARSSNPKIAAVVYNIQKSTGSDELKHYAISSLQTAAAIIQAPELTKKVRRSSKSKDTTTVQLRQTLQSTLASISLNKASDQEFTDVLKQNMDVLLRMPALENLLDMLYDLLDGMNSELRPQALRILALQFGTKRNSTDAVREKALQLLQKLNEYLKHSPTEAQFQASLVCVDRVAGVCGRKHPDAILTTAEIMVTDVGLKQNQDSPKQMTPLLLTLVSLIETLKQNCVPLVPPILKQALPLFDTFTSSESDHAAFCALCLLLSTIFSHAAFMVSENDLQYLLDVAINAKARFRIDQETSDYSSLTETITHKVDLETIVNATVSLLRGGAVDKCGAEMLRMVGEAISQSPKNNVIRHAENISQLFIAVLGQGTAVGEGTGTKQGQEHILSEQLKITMISFVYKINDTTLRPIFESWVDWATTPDAAGMQVLVDRQVGLYDLLTHFFDTLKGIVTSYAAYLIHPISMLLGGTASNYKNQSQPERTLIERSLLLLKTIAAHDQDAFFGAPSHFDPIGPSLSKLLTLASSKAMRRLVSGSVIPTIVALAVATMDSPQTHTILSHHIVQLKSAESAQVRLASIKTLLALTEDEELGDEFISNTIGIGAGEGEGARGGGTSVGEIMVYVNEMLEDDDEDVEHAVRSWVQLVRSKVGEDTFEV